MARRIRFTSTARLHDFVARHSAHEIERRAVDELRTQHPELSAGVSRPRREVVPGLSGARCAGGVCRARRGDGWRPSFCSAPSSSPGPALRLFGLFSERFMRRRPRTFSDGWLPTYSIVIALYREAAAVPDLVTAWSNPLTDTSNPIRIFRSLKKDGVSQWDFGFLYARLTICVGERLCRRHQERHALFREAPCFCFTTRSGVRTDGSI